MSPLQLLPRMKMGNYLKGSVQYLGLRCIRYGATRIVVPFARVCPPRDTVSLAQRPTINAGGRRRMDSQMTPMR